MQVHWKASDDDIKAWAERHDLISRSLSELRCIAEDAMTMDRATVDTRTPSPASPSPGAAGQIADLQARLARKVMELASLEYAVRHHLNDKSMGADIASILDNAMRCIFMTHGNWDTLSSRAPKPASKVTWHRVNLPPTRDEDGLSTRQGKADKAYDDGWNSAIAKVQEMNPPKPASAGGELQDRVAPWMQECFGPVISADRLERSDRFIEESLELVQACGYDKSRAHALVEYVYGRPVGHAPQEVGGVMVTLAALCLAHGFNMHEEGAREVDRVSDPAIIEKIRAKQASKPTGSALPIAAEADTANKVDRIRLHGDAPQSCAYGKCDGSCIELGPCNR